MMKVELSIKIDWIQGSRETKAHLIRQLGWGYANNELIFVFNIDLLHRFNNFY